MKTDRPKSRINGKINPEYQRWYVEQRKQSGNPVKRGRTTEQQREFRKTEKGKEAIRKYRSTDNFKQSQKKYKASENGRQTLKIARAKKLGPDGYADYVMRSLKYYNRIEDDY